MQITLEWGIPEDGKAFAIAPTPGGDYLVPRGSARFRPGDILQEQSALHRIFAALDGSTEAFARFANTYGSLGIPGYRPGPASEPIAVYRNARVWLAHLCRLLDEWHDNEELCALRNVHHDQNRYIVPRPELADLSCPIGQWFKVWGVEVIPGDEAGLREWVVSHYLQEMLEQELVRVATVRPLLRDSLETRGGIQIRARHLWGALVSSLFTDIVQARRYGRCAVCGNPFLLSSKATYHPRQTCSGKCRVALHRRRHADDPGKHDGPAP